MPKTEWLLEHSLFFTARAVDHLKNERSSEAAKIAVVDFSTGLDFLFQSQLRQISPCLQLNDVDSKDSKTLLPLESSFNRLLNCGLLTESTSSKFLRLIRHLLALKTDLFVNPFPAPSYQVVLSITVRLLEQMCRYTYETEKSDCFEKQWIRAMQIEASIWEAIRPTISAYVSDDTFFFRCPECHQTAAYIDGPYAEEDYLPGEGEGMPTFWGRCLFCRHQEDIYSFQPKLIIENLFEQPSSSDLVRNLYGKDAGGSYITEPTFSYSLVSCGPDGSDDISHPDQCDEEEKILRVPSSHIEKIVCSSNLIPDTEEALEEENYPLSTYRYACCTCGRSFNKNF